MNDFLQRFIAHLKPAGRVLDLGAGQGVQANQLASLGFKVEAVDREAPAAQDDRVTWRVQTAESFVEGLKEEEKYDGMLLRNIIQMLDKPWVLETGLPKLLSALRPNGVLAIATFWKEPEPLFRKAMRLYTADEIIQAINPCSVLLWEQVTDNINDLEGRLRTFHVIRILLEKR